MKKKMDVSQSQINLFRKCPYAYYLRYEFKKQPIMFDPSVMEVGKKVHTAIERYYRDCFQTEASKDEILYNIYSILKLDWDVLLPADYLRKAYQCLKHFSEFEFNNINNGNEVKPLSELKIKADGLYGIIDYFSPNKEKVIDFKTNTKAYIGYDNKMQAVMYKILIKQKFNIDINYFTLQFLYPGEVRTIKFDKKLEKIEEDLYDYVKKIEEAWRRNHFPKLPRTEKTCNGCDYKYYCGGVD